MPDILLQKLIPMRAGKRILSSGGQLVLLGLPGCTRALCVLPRGQPYYSPTRTQARTTNSHLVHMGSQKTNNNIKEVKLPAESFEGTVIRTGPP